MYLIAYDISDPRRLRRVAKLLNRFGVRIQKSVFACDIDDRRYGDLKRRLREYRHEGDSIISFRFPAAVPHEELGLPRHPYAPLTLASAEKSTFPAEPDVSWLPEDFENPF